MKCILIFLSLVWYLNNAYAQHKNHTDAKTTDSIQKLYTGADRIVGIVSSTGNLVTYHLIVSDTTINYDNKKMPALVAVC